MYNEVIIRLRATCDLLKDFSTLMKHFNQISKKYDISLNEIKNLNSFEQNSLRELIESLPPKKLDLVIRAMTKIKAFRHNTGNFTEHTPEELDEFVDKLELLIKEYTTTALESDKFTTDQVTSNSTTARNASRQHPNQELITSAKIIRKLLGPMDKNESVRMIRNDRDARR